MNDIRSSIITVLVIVAVILWLLLLPVPTKAEETEMTKLTVTANMLNGRAKPGKQSSVEAVFDRGDILEALGWSENHHWIEVRGGETGTVWVWWGYVSERTDETRWWNNCGTKVKIRKEPFGTVTKYLKRGGEVVVDQIVLGWGHCSDGWIDLSYLTEED